MRVISTLICSLAVAISACSEQGTPSRVGATAAEFPSVADPRLQQGREIWLETCKACHGYGLAGAPRIGDIEAWKPRIAQGIDTLHQHALNGLLGKSGTEMPARGGSDSLSDEQVKAAVDYMVASSETN